MEQTYEALRVFAGSWGLVWLFGAFVVVLLVTLRPGTRERHRDIADIPFRHDDRPAAAAADDDSEARS